MTKIRITVNRFEYIKSCLNHCGVYYSFNSFRRFIVSSDKA